MRDAVLIALAISAWATMASAEPLRLDCEREILGDKVVLYVDTEKMTMRVESDFFGVRDKKDLKIDTVGPRKILARSGRPSYRIGHILDRQSGVYTEIHVSNGNETESLFICKRGKPLL